MKNVKPTYKELEFQITELKKRNQEIANQSEHRFQGLLNSMSENFMLVELIYNMEGNVTDYCFLQVNQAFEKSVRKPKEEIINKRAKEVFKVIDDYWLKIYAQVDKTGKAMSYSNLSGEMNRYYTIYACKQKKGVIAITFNDITAHNLAELELFKAKAKAEESDKLKSAFLANMSHEIRTPLNLVLGFSSLLKKNNVSEKKREEYLSIIESSGKRLLQIINDLVDLSKIDSNQLNLFYEACNLNELLDNLKEQFNSDFNDLKLNIVTTKGLNGSNAKIVTDQSRLLQILTHLIDNALKYAPSGNIYVGYEQQGTMLKFYVKDEGIGIDPTKHSLIFERFTQLDNNPLNDTSGTGLGLSVVKELTKLMKGEVWVESEKGKGAAFYFTIPYQIAN